MPTRFNPSNEGRREQAYVRAFLPDGWHIRLKVVCAKLDTSQQTILYPIICSEIERLEREIELMEQEGLMEQGGRPTSRRDKKASYTGSRRAS